MKKLLSLSLLPLGLLSVTNAAIVAGDTIGIDFGTIAPSGPNTFNQFDAFTNTIADNTSLAWSTFGINSGVMQNTLGADVTGVDLTVENQSSDDTSDANVVNGSSGPAPFDVADIYSDTLISNNQAGSVPDGSYLLLTFSGLDDSLTYDLTGGFDGVNTNFDTTWSFDSSSAGISMTENDTIGSFLTTPGASTGYQTVTGLQTDGSGNLVIQLTKATNHIVVGGLTLTAVPEPGTSALLAGCLALGSVMLRRRS